MEHYDEEILAAKKALEREKYTSLETGIYIGDELVHFAERTFKEQKFSIVLPERFLSMPDAIKDKKYPARNAPAVIMTGLSTSVNFSFNSLPCKLLDKEELKELGNKFQSAVKNPNPSIRFGDIEERTTEGGRDMYGFGFTGYGIDGQNYNRMAFVRMSSFVLHVSFNCPEYDRLKWNPAVGQMLATIKEES